MKFSDVLNIETTPDQFYQNMLVQSNVAAMRQATQARAQIIVEKFPQVVTLTLEQAELAMQGLHILPGTEARPYFVGNPPDWYANPVHDNEYVWVLNRMFYWRTLLAAFTLTGQRRFAQKVIGELRDWLARCPCPPIVTDFATVYDSFSHPVTPWRSLEVGIRMYETWPWIVDHLLGTDLLTPEILADLAVSFHMHGEVLSTICPVFWPKADHNHYLMENLGLLKLACTFPSLKKSALWKDHAVHELERCAAAQITEDGGQIEGCPHYHNGCVYWFCLAQHIANRYDLRFSDDYTRRVKNMLTYSLNSFRPTGTSVPWGDSDADRIAINSALWEHIAFGDLDAMRLLVQLSGTKAVYQELFKNIWHIPDIERLFAELEQPISRVPARVSWQHNLKQVMLRTGWDSDAFSLFFAARSPVNNSHAHIDPMGFDFTALGKPLIVDPGRYCYRDDEDRRTFKSAAWHNTLTVNHRDPFEYKTSWVYGSQKEASILHVIDQPRLLAVEAIQHNYEPTVHRRAVLLIDSTALIVLDHLTGLQPDSSVQIYYHLDTTDVTWNPQQHQATAHISDVGLVIASDENLQGALLPGRVSDFLDTARASIRLRLEDVSSHLPERVYVSVIVPHRLTTPVPQVTLQRLKQGKEQLLCSFDINGRSYIVQWDNQGLSLPVCP